MPSFFQRSDRPQWPPPKKAQPSPAEPSPPLAQPQPPHPQLELPAQAEPAVGDSVDMVQIESDLKQWFGPAPMNHPYIAALFEACLARRQEEIAAKETA